MVRTLGSRARLHYWKVKEGVIMDKEFFKEYSEKHVYFVDLSVPEMLEDLLRGLNKQNKQYSLID